MAQPRILTATLALAGLVMALPAAAQGNPGCAATEPLTPLGKRLIAYDRQSQDELRRFIYRTAPIYQLNWYDTKAWLQTRRESAACIAMAEAASRSAGAAPTTVPR